MKNRKNRFKIRDDVFKTAELAHEGKSNSFKKNKISCTSIDLATILRFCISIVSLDLPEIVRAHEIHPPLSFVKFKWGF
jgi:hypothetical protein